MVSVYFSNGNLKRFHRRQQKEKKVFLPPHPRHLKVGLVKVLRRQH